MAALKEQATTGTSGRHDVMTSPPQRARKPGLTAYDKHVRKGRITGTRAGAIVGLSKYKRPIDVWREIVEGYETPFDNEDELLWGNIVEDSLIEWAAQKLGAVKVEPGQATVHPDDSRFAATPDAILTLADGERVVLECKAPRQGEDWGEDGSNDIPRYHKMQVQMEMACANVWGGYVCALVWSRPRIYAVPRHQGLIDFLMGSGDRFWKAYVETKMAPPVDGSPGWSRYLKELYPVPETERVDELDEDDPAGMLAQSYIENTAKEREAKEAKSDIANKLKAVIGSNRKGIQGDGWRALWSQVKSKSINWEQYARALGGTDADARKFYSKDSVSRRFSCRKVK